MRPEKLRLKKSIGIKSGMGMSEISIDFTSLPDGIIVFEALNGTGKTTIIDNMHFYRLMPSRAKTYSPNAFNYYDEFYDGDACIEFIAVYESVRYRKLICIDALKREQDAYLYREGPLGWEPLNPDGKTGSYDKIVAETFGSPEMYFKSTFRSQDAKPLMNYAKADIKTLLAELYGNGAMKTFYEKANKILGKLEGWLETLLEKKRELTDVISRKSEIELAIKSVNGNIRSLEKQIAAKDTDRAAAEQKLRHIENKIGLQAASVKRKEEVQSQIQSRETLRNSQEEEKQSKLDELTERRENLEERLEGLRKLVSSVSTIRQRILQKVNIARAAELVKKAVFTIETNLADERVKLEDIRKKEATIKDKEGGLERYRLQTEADSNLLAQEKNQLQKDVGKLERVPCKGTEFASTCEFTCSAAKAPTQIVVIDERLAELCKSMKSKESSLLEEINDLKIEIQDKVQHEETEKEIIKQLADAKSKLNGLEKKLEDVTSLEQSLVEAKAAEAKIPEIENQIRDIDKAKQDYLAITESALEGLNSELDTLRREVAGIVTDETFDSQQNEANRAIDGFVKELENARAMKSAQEKILGSEEEKIRVIESSERSLIGTKNRITYLTQEISQWTIIAKALGPDGILALEIDDAGPTISSHANELLKVYGGRYIIRIETQTMTKDGKEMKEDFDIIVVDTVTGEKKSLKKMSGGQRLLIEDVLARAICICNSTVNGVRHEAIFTDEKDGALDAENKKYFFLAKRRVLELGGHKQEYCVTHTTDLIEMADARIKLGIGSIEIIQNN